MGSTGPSAGTPLVSPADPALAPRWLKAVGFAIGIMLLGAAAYVLLSNREELDKAYRAARAAPAWLVLAVLLLPLGNWAITSAIFWVLTRRFAPVGKWEMGALIGSAWLLNMLPFKPGLLGRLAYHKAISGIPYTTSVLVTITAMLTGAAGIVIALAAQFAIDTPLRHAAPAGVLAPTIGLVFALALGPTSLLAWRTRAKGLPAFSGSCAIAIAVLLRIADTHLWALRYFLAFGLIGHGQHYGVCVVVSGVSQIAGQFPVQFGLREWAVGVSSGVLHPGGGAPSAAGVIPGLSVDLICRAAEICCALPVGIVTSAWVYRRLRRARA